MYRMAAYCRLSKEDGGNRVSESIENQLKLIREYVGRNGDLEIADVYIDDGYSGLYFAGRPEFQRMMEDIYAGRIQGVITKDISRLGRDHIETGNYMERVFPSLGIRYIAVLDGVDSLSHSNEELAQFKTILNDMYSRDISKKIRGSLNAQKKRGRFMSGFAPYGYLRDPDDRRHFIIDREAAKTVRRIYDLYLAGYSGDAIGRMLNAEGVLTPSEYKRRVLGLRYANAKERAGARGWARPTIRVILKNRVYTGTMVQHKSEKISYKIRKCRYIPEEQQYIVEGTHEPIIREEVFEQVQALMKKRRRTPGIADWMEKRSFPYPIGQTHKANPYVGILVCGDCGSNMQRVASRNGYECGAYHRKGNQVCCSHFVKKEVLDAVLRRELEKQAALALNGEDRNLLCRPAGGPEAERRLKEAEQEMEGLRKKLDKIREYRRKTCENYMDGLLEEEEYAFYKGDYERQEQALRTDLRLVQKEKRRWEEIIRKEGIEKAPCREGYIRKDRGQGVGETEEAVPETQKHPEAQRSVLEGFAREGTVAEVTRELVAELVDTITIDSGRNLEITFRFRPP